MLSITIEIIFFTKTVNSFFEMTPSLFLSNFLNSLLISFFEGGSISINLFKFVKKIPNSSLSIVLFPSKSISLNNLFTTSVKIFPLKILSLILSLISS
jgi:hypothetical protein